MQSLRTSVQRGVQCKGCTQRPAGRKWQCQCAAVVEQTDVKRTPPYWTGQSNLVSKAINMAINNPALWAVMKVGARKAMIKTAEKSGIPWQETYTELQQSQALKELKEQLENPDISYPDYYLKKFHAYDAGNLDWQAVCELEPATAATAVRVFKHDHLAPDAAEDAMRDSFLDGLQAYCQKHSVKVKTAVDVGCAGGDSSRRLAARMPQAQLMGLDLSPHFLALAELRRRQAEPETPAACISYTHGNAEALPLEQTSQDLVTASYVMHELPAENSRSFLREAQRVLKPGGVIALVDGDPWSEVHQKMPIPIATLMKSTEPWDDEYFALDLEGAMQAAGFSDIVYLPVNYRHRVMLGIAS